MSRISHCAQANPSEDDDTNFALGLSSFSNIKALELDNVMMAEEWLESALPFSTTLRSLTLRTDVVCRDIWAFIRAFRNLERLDLDLDSFRYNDDDPREFVDPNQEENKTHVFLPALQHLSISSNEPSDPLILLYAFANSSHRSPLLATIKVDVPYSTQHQLAWYQFLDVLNRLPTTVRRVTFGPNSPSTSSAILQVIRSLYGSPHHDSIHFVPGIWPSIEDPVAYSLAERTPEACTRAIAAYRAREESIFYLDWAARQVEHLHKIDDLAGAEEMVKLLEAVKTRAVVHRQ